MINMNINEDEKRVYIDVSGFISKKEASNFLNTYKQTMKNKKISLYKLHRLSLNVKMKKI